MKAARLHSFNEDLKIDEVDEPKISGPHDVIVRIGAAGLCRTDIHIRDGDWKAVQDGAGFGLPYTLGHENAGWVHEIGSAVSTVNVGDTVIVHPLITCGLCLEPLARRALGRPLFGELRGSWLVWGAEVALGVVAAGLFIFVIAAARRERGPAPV